MFLRPARMADEAQMRAGHEELHPINFAYLVHPELSWGEQLNLMDTSAQGVNLPAGRVPADFLVAEVPSAATGEPDLVGRVSIRHTLTPVLEQIGGHVGYAVRPAFRRHGYGTQMLRLSIERLRAIGVEDVLVTCDDDNIGSIRVIEACGGMLADVQQWADGIPGTRRYWIDSRA